MDAKFKSLKTTPIKFDKDGGVVKNEFATLTVDIPMDSPGQREAVTKLLGLLSREWIHVDVYCARQQEEETESDGSEESVEMTHTSPTGKTQSAKLTSDEANSQINMLEQITE